MAGLVQARQGVAYLEASSVEIANLLTPHDFQRWLALQDIGCVIGYSRQASACPLARFLREEGLQEPQVTQKVILFNVEGALHCCPTPLWAAFFVQEVDADASRGESWVAPPLHCSRVISTRRKSPA